MAKRPTIETENINYAEGGGARIDAETYEVMKNAILACVPKSPDSITLSDLDKNVHEALRDGLPGGRKITWHLMAVKLDLEKKGLINRLKDAKPQRLSQP